VPRTKSRCTPYRRSNRALRVGGCENRSRALLTPVDIREAAPEEPWAALGDHAAMCLARIAQATPASKYFFSGRDPQHPVSSQHARKWLHAWEVKLELPPITFEQLTKAYKRGSLRSSPTLATATGELGMSGYDFQELNNPPREGASRQTQLALGPCTPPGGGSP